MYSRRHLLRRITVERKRSEAKRRQNCYSAEHGRDKATAHTGGASTSSHLAHPSRISDVGFQDRVPGWGSKTRPAAKMRRRQHGAELGIGSTAQCLPVSITPCTEYLYGAEIAGEGTQATPGKFQGYEIRDKDIRIRKKRAMILLRTGVRITSLRGSGKLGPGATGPTG